MGLKEPHRAQQQSSRLLTMNNNSNKERIVYRNMLYPPWSQNTVRKFNPKDNLYS